MTETPQDTFPDSEHCLARVHCTTCRAATPDGEVFRADMVKLHPKTEGGVNFRCPDGLGVGGPVPPRPAKVACPPRLVSSEGLLPADPPVAPVDVDNVRISLCIASCNENPWELLATVADAMSKRNHGRPEPLRGTYRRPDEVVVVDDLSKPSEDRSKVYGFLADMGAKVLISDSRLGTSAGKGAACRAASGSLLVVADAHVRFGLEFFDEILDIHSRHPGAAINPSIYGFATVDPAESPIRGGELHWHESGCLESRWRARAADGEHEISSLLGGCYVVPRSVYDQAGGFADEHYGYGLDEPSLSWRIWATGGWILQAASPLRRGRPTPWIRHNFNRPAWDGSTAGWEVPYNRFVSAFVGLEDARFNAFTLPAAKKLDVWPEISAEFDRRYGFIEARRNLFQARRTVDDAALFRRLDLAVPGVAPAEGSNCGCSKSRTEAGDGKKLGLREMP